jgi:hypothetical protein
MRSARLLHRAVPVAPLSREQRAALRAAGRIYSAIDEATATGDLRRVRAHLAALLIILRAHGGDR